MPKKSSFAKALADAEKRLAKAKEERTCALNKVSQLSQEIPALEQTIIALKSQLGEKVVMPLAASTSTGVIPRVDMAGGQPSGERAGAVDMKNIPEEIAKHLVLDLSDMGSIPAAQPEEKSADTAPTTK